VGINEDPRFYTLKFLLPDGQEHVAITRYSALRAFYEVNFALFTSWLRNCPDPCSSRCSMLRAMCVTGVPCRGGNGSVVVIARADHAVLLLTRIRRLVHHAERTAAEDHHPSQHQLPGMPPFSRLYSSHAISIWSVRKARPPGYISNDHP
jgi:hypothetical protein